MKARDNPFRTECIERVPFRLPGVTWEQLLRQLRDLHFRAAVIGAHGSGKTTFLDHLEPRLAAEGFRVRRSKLDEERQRLMPEELAEFVVGLGERDIVMLDGAEQLSALAWWRFARACRCAGGLIITSHVSGRMPTLIQFQPQPSLLAQLIGDLTGDANFVLACDSKAIFHRHAGNVRHALLECYDRCAARP